MGFPSAGPGSLSLSTAPGALLSADGLLRGCSTRHRRLGSQVKVDVLSRANKGMKTTRVHEVSASRQSHRATIECNKPRALFHVIYIVRRAASRRATRTLEHCCCCCCQ